MSSQGDFGLWVSEAIARTPVRARLESCSAVVLERVAFGAGQTEWFFCKGPSDLNRIERELRPGSTVSFYFDGRIGCTRRPEELLEIAGRVIDAGRECVLGALHQNGIEIAKDFVTRRSEVQEFIAEHSITALFFAGDYPAADNDGVAAVTFVVPDEDGIVRHHPH